MGTTYVFKCTQCDHESESSGKLDYGMETVVEPYKCDYCNDIVDVKVGNFGRKILKEELPEGFERICYRCPECDGKQITPWDEKMYPCPKCDHKMENIGPSINWD